MKDTTQDGYPIKFSDGGRWQAGYKGFAQDCVARAISLAFDQADEYKVIYHRLAQGQKDYGLPATARNGIRPHVSSTLLKAQGATYTDLKRLKRPLQPGDWPKGNYILTFSRHFSAVIDGCVYDTHDPTTKRRGAGVKLLHGIWDCNHVLPITLRAGEIRIPDPDLLLLAAERAPRGKA